MAACSGCGPSGARQLLAMAMGRARHLCCSSPSWSLAISGALLMVLRTPAGGAGPARPPGAAPARGTPQSWPTPPPVRPACPPAPRASRGPRQARARAIRRAARSRAWPGLLPLRRRQSESMRPARCAAFSVWTKWLGEGGGAGRLMPARRMLGATLRRVPTCGSDSLAALGSTPQEVQRRSPHHDAAHVASAPGAANPGQVSRKTGRLASCRPACCARERLLFLGCNACAAAGS